MPQFYVLINPWMNSMFGTTVHTSSNSASNRSSMIVGCRDVDKAFKLRQFLLEYHQRTGRWFNRYEHMSWNNNGNTSLHLSENPCSSSCQSLSDSCLLIAPMDFDTKLVNPMRKELHAHKLCMKTFNYAHLFLIERIDDDVIASFDDYKTTLTLQGLFVDMNAVGLIPTPQTDWKFIESCWNLY
jgi:hypothetical protein